MKIRPFNFIKRNPSKNINCNPPLKNLSKIPNNMLTQKKLTVDEQLVKITESIKEILSDIVNKDKKILAQLN